MDRSTTSTCLVLVLCTLVGTARADCPSTAGIVLGTIAGTLLVCGVVFALVYLYLKRRKQQDDDKAKLDDKKNVERGYDNPTYKDDETKERGKERGYSFKDTYIPAKETELQAKPQAQNETKQGRVAQGNGQVGVRPNNAIVKTGSRGSLDNKRTADPEIITVTLESNDSIGLGFNIYGSMSEGIFVSQVHNRGPASENGNIKPGDRIMSISISFENIVYEDALTILSYASPYPVTLQLQKLSQQQAATPTEHNERSPDDLLHPLHSQNRSQSMDDVSKISKEPYIVPRRTYSGFHKQTPAIQTSASVGDDLDTGLSEGKLAKWDPAGQLNVTTEATVHSTSKGSSRRSSNSSVGVEEPVVNAEVAPRKEVSLDLKSATGIFSSGPNSAEIEKEAGTDIFGRGISLKDKDDEYEKPEVPSVGPPGDDKEEGENEAPSINLSSLPPGSVTIDHTVDLQVNGEVNGDIAPADQTTASLDVNIDDSLLERADPDNSSTEAKPAEKTQDILNNFFGDEPSLLEQLGFNDQEGTTTLTQTETTRTVGEDGSTVTTKQTTTTTVSEGHGRKTSHSTSSSDSSHSSRDSSPERHGKSGKSTGPVDSPLIRKKADGGLSFDISAMEFEAMPDKAPTLEEKPRGEPKGGIAYYVRIDESMKASPAEPVEIGQDLEDRPSQMSSLALDEPTITTTSTTSDSTPSETGGSTLEKKLLIESNNNEIIDGTRHKVFHLSNGDSQEPSQQPVQGSVNLSMSGFNAELDDSQA